MFIRVILASIAIAIVLVLVRLWFVLPNRKRNKNVNVFTDDDNKSKALHLLIILGSGGHTAEMFRMLSGCGKRKKGGREWCSTFCTRTYLLADTDSHSFDKLSSFESNEQLGGKLEVIKVKRSREVGQSMGSSLLSSFYALLSSLHLPFLLLPDLIITNGPGTAVPICLAAYIPRLLGIKKIRIMYIESICRVEGLSLTGKMLLPLCDEFIVQWPELASKYPTTSYFGLLSH